ncbi:DUF3152 domain-containing protein [Streptomyces sp. NPDC005786]|uniref:DUF3152 domain-containing protein n=1 Tax=Streptomyces sp. NPDC005786 TaxID=3154891 RepID=UPI0033FCF4A6
MAVERRQRQAQRQGRGNRRRLRPTRRRRSRIRVLAAVLVPAALIGVVLIAAPRWAGGDGLPASAAAPESPEAPRSPGPDHPPSSPAAKPKATTAPPAPAPSATARTPRIPASGPGTFAVARAGASSGGGNAYRVEVEDGSGVDPDEAAAEVARILAAPRGWAHGGAHSFRQVTTGPAGLVIRIATAATTDRICGKGGLNTRGEVNCRVGTDVMVNLKRWQTGSPEFDGPLADYRALIVNHEVGHWLGHGHETCPGKGRPAPAMMQQIYGLKGCVSNAWPYGTNGKYLGGPTVP